MGDKERYIDKHRLSVAGDDSRLGKHSRNIGTLQDSFSNKNVT